ncbi:sugar ABC transporter permease [PVC group bacterium]|nr:sugar ABC transporter permease [PVC group bacterium]
MAQTIRTKETIAGYGFLLPNLIGFLAFTSIPVLASLVLGFMRWDLTSPPVYIGLENFVNLLGFTKENGHWIPNDGRFWYYVYNTMFFMLGIPISMAASLFLAVVLNNKMKGISVVRTVYFMPTLASGIAIYVLWRWIFNEEFGLLNILLGHFGIDGPGWLTNRALAKPSLIFMGIWMNMGGYNMILYLAGIQGIPQELYEASAIDGASSWQKFQHITWPMLGPTTFFIFIMSVIAGFQGGFDAAFVMTGGGPAGATTTVSYYIYQNAYEWFHMGYAASIAWVLFLSVFIVTLMNWKYGGKVVHYQ